MLMAGIWTSQRDAAPRSFGDRVLPTTHLFALRPGVDAERDRAPGSSPRSWRTACRRTRSRKLLARRGRRVADLRPPDRGLHGPRPDRRRRRARRDHRPRRSSSAASRSACCARSASGSGWCSSSFLLESSFIALTSIVVGTGLGLAVAYNVIARLAAAAELGATSASTCPGSPSAIIFLAVYVVALATTLVPALPGRRASIPPRRCATSSPYRQLTRPVGREGPT